jgi:hypothetical protein
MEIPKTWSTSSRPLGIGNSGILSGFRQNIFRERMTSDLIASVLPIQQSLSCLGDLACVSNRQEAQQQSRV